MTTNPAQLAETDVNLVQAFIKTNIAGALAIQRTDRNADVSTEIPASYFFYRKPKVLQCPAVFTVPMRFNFRQAQMGANHVNAIHTMGISVVVEDPQEDLCVVKGWRYQAALFQILDNAQIRGSDPTNPVFLTVIIDSQEFSPTFTDTMSGTNIFRQEVLFTCDINHVENF